MVKMEVCIYRLRVSFFFITVPGTSMVLTGIHKLRETSSLPCAIFRHHYYLIEWIFFFIFQRNHIRIMIILIKSLPFLLKSFYPFYSMVFYMPEIITTKCFDELVRNYLMRLSRLDMKSR